MARKRQHPDGLIDLLFEVAMEIPIAGVVLGILFACFGVYCTWINPTGIHGVAFLIGYVALLTGGLLGGIGFFGMARSRRAREARASRLDAVCTEEDLRHMNWKQFEQLVADTFQRQGYRVREVGGSGDGGVDIVLTGTDSEHLVQCKQYRAWSVGEPKVREFYGAMAAHQTRCAGIIVTCGRFTEPARRFAIGKPLHLMDGEEFVKLIRDTNPIAPAVANFTAFPEHDNRPAVPLCPACAIAMVKRTAKKGAKVGQQFWGCQNYPRCRAIVQVVSARSDNHS